MSVKIYEALSEGLERPDSYWGPIGELQGQGWARVWGRHRDSDTLEISNYETVLSFLSENYQLWEDYRVEGSSHWAFGWADEIMVRALQCGCEKWEDADFYNEYSSDRFRCRTCAEVGSIRPIFFDMFDFAESIKDYPVLDEEDYSRREYEETCEWIEDNLYRAINEVDEDMPDEFKPEAGEVFSYLFEVYSVSSVEDIGDFGWLVEAVRDISRKKQDAPNPDQLALKETANESE